MPVPPDGAGLRFCMVTTFYPPYHFGGDAIAVQRLAHALARRGHEVDVIHDLDAFAMQHRGAFPDPMPEPPGVRVHRLRSRLGRLSCLLTHQLGRPIVHGRRIRRIIRDGRFDVIHFHNVSLVGGPGVLSYGSGIKLYTAHEHWLVCPTHILWRHGRELCTGRECLRCVLRQRRPPQLWRRTRLLEKSAKHVDAFIAPSHFTAAKHRQMGFAPEWDVLPGFLEDTWGRFPTCQGKQPATGPGRLETCPTERPYLLFVGRLERAKGVQDLIPHFTGEDGSDLLIAGCGTDEPWLRSLAGRNSRVHFLGQKNQEELRPLYQHAVGVLVPSLCYETFGLVVLEAFREGTPVIARNREALAEIVTESGGGILFNTPSDLGQAIRRLNSEPELRHRLGAAGQSAWRERWTEDLVMERYFAIIRRIALRKRAGHVSERLRPDVRDGHVGDRAAHSQTAPPPGAGVDVPLAGPERVGHLDSSRSLSAAD